MSAVMVVGGVEDIVDNSVTSVVMAAVVGVDMVKVRMAMGWWSVNWTRLVHRGSVVHGSLIHGGWLLVLVDITVVDDGRRRIVSVVGIVGVVMMVRHLEVALWVPEV